MTDPTQPGDGQQFTPGTREEIRIPWRLLIALVVLALLVVFALQNTESVDMEFLGWNFSAPLILVIGITFAAAVIIWSLGGWVVRRRRRSRAAPPG